MIVDTSALVSILLNEPGNELLLQKADRAEALFVGAPTALETAMVLSARFRRDARPMLAGLLRRMDAEIIDFNENHYETAVDAYLRFGKGRHPAALNFGDCMTYALAAISGLPLLCAGTDFPKTGIQCA